MVPDPSFLRKINEKKGLNETVLIYAHSCTEKRKTEQGLSLNGKYSNKLVLYRVRTLVIFSEHEMGHYLLSI